MRSATDVLPLAAPAPVPGGARPEKQTADPGDSEMARQGLEGEGS
jgi:hypothetical protein